MVNYQKGDYSTMNDATVLDQHCINGNSVQKNKGKRPCYELAGDRLM